MRRLDAAGLAAALAALALGVVLFVAAAGGIGLSAWGALAAACAAAGGALLALGLADRDE